MLVTFEQAPISFEYLRNAAQIGLNFIEVVDPAQAPTYTIDSTCLRFPSSALSPALLSEVQQGVVIKDDSTGFLGFGRNTVWPAIA